jgi:hypothetical protein
MKVSPQQITDVDRPELAETFVDSLALSTFDGAAARLTFCVLRMQEPQQGKPAQFNRYPVCRMVLTPDATVELFNRLNQMMGALQKLGLVKMEPGKPPQSVEQKPQ